MKSGETFQEITMNVMNKPTNQPKNSHDHNNSLPPSPPPAAVTSTAKLSLTFLVIYGHTQIHNISKHWCQIIDTYYTLQPWLCVKHLQKFPTFEYLQKGELAVTTTEKKTNNDKVTWRYSRYRIVSNG